MPVMFILIAAGYISTLLAECRSLILLPPKWKRVNNFWTRQDYSV